MQEKFKHEPRQIRMLIMIAIILAYMLVELSVGVIGNCLSLVADSFNMISDAIGLTVGYVTIRLGKKKVDKRQTLGWKRSEVLGAFFNGSFLLSSSFFLMTEIASKFMEPEGIEKIDLVLYTGIGGIVVNIFGITMINDFQCLKKNQQSESQSEEVEQKPKKDIAMHGAFLLVFQDFMGSVVVIVSVLIQKFCKEWNGCNYVDPVCSLIMVAFLISAAMPLLKEVNAILMMRSPEEVDEVHDKLGAIENVVGMKDFHMWQLVPDVYIAHCHLIVNTVDAQRIIEIKKASRQVFSQYNCKQSTLEIVYQNEQTTDASISLQDTDDTNTINIDEKQVLLPK